MGSGRTKHSTEPLERDSPNDPLGHSGYGPAFGERLHKETVPQVRYECKQKKKGSKIIRSPFAQSGW
jgi:hypothetical protein